MVAETSEQEKYLKILIQLQSNEAVLLAILNRLDNLNGKNADNEEESFNMFKSEFERLSKNNRKNLLELLNKKE